MQAAFIGNWTCARVEEYRGDYNGGILKLSINFDLNITPCINTDHSTWF